MRRNNIERVKKASGRLVDRDEMHYCMPIPMTPTRKRVSNVGSKGFVQWYGIAWHSMGCDSCATNHRNSLP